MTRKPHGLVKLTVEEARKEVESLSMTPLFSEYLGSKYPLDVICHCGNHFRPNLGNLRRGAKCKECGYKNRDNRRTPLSEVREYFASQGCLLLVSKFDYEGSAKQLTFRCSCGETWSTTYYNFRQGVRCGKCTVKKYSGPNNYNYKPDLTDEERERYRYDSRLREWSRVVKERDRFTCVFCEDDTGGNLMSHHLDGYSEFPEKRYDVDNGVTLCDICHKDFHDMYGYGGNTREQFEELTSKFSISWGAVTS